MAARIISRAMSLTKLGRKLRDLIEQALGLLRRVLQNLVPEMVDLETGGGGQVALGRLDTANLHLEEELGDLDGKAAADAADASLSGEVDVEGVLEEGEVGAGERVGGKGRTQGAKGGQVCRGNHRVGKSIRLLLPDWNP